MAKPKLLPDDVKNPLPVAGLSDNEPARCVRVPEVQVLEGEVCFYDARGLDPSPEDVLLCGLVVCCANPV